MNDLLAPLFASHLTQVKNIADRALEKAGFDHLLIASGVEKFQFLDDRPYTFYANPQFKWWVPLDHHPCCWIAYTPGQKPILVYYQPDDYWHVPPSAPSGYWLEHFDLKVISNPDDAAQYLPKNIARCAIIAEADTQLADYIPNNPLALLHVLHFNRAPKTEYELQLMRAASTRAVPAHRAAEAGFRAGLSELEIHRNYCAAAGHRESDLPYTNIIALNEHSATLHYQYQNANRPNAHRSLLIDAGAQVNGYAADITRTYSNGDTEFSALLDAVDQAQQIMVSRVRAGRDYRDLHLACHHDLAKILHAQDFVRMSPESMVESGVSATFFPHGLGHLIGLQVHDVAGFARDESGATIDRPVGHPYLRLTRVIEKDFVLTIEPGIYFIDTLLSKLKQTPHANVVNWEKVERMKPFGGIRIEDDVRVTIGDPENLTRDAFAKN